MFKKFVYMKTMCNLASDLCQTNKLNIMKKPHDYKVLSNKRCRRCNTKLKKNLVEKIPSADLCYKCFQIEVKKNPTYIKKHCQTINLQS